MSEISDRLLQAIKKKGYSYADLQALTGIHRATLQRYATGTTPKIPMDKIEIMANALDVSPAWLMCWTDNVNYPPDAANPIIRELYTDTYREMNKINVEGLKLFSSLSSVQKMQVIDYMKYLTHKPFKDDED